MMTDFESKFLLAFAEFADPLAAEDPAWGHEVESETASMRLFASAVAAATGVPSSFRTIERLATYWNHLDARTFFGGLLVYVGAHPDRLTYQGQTDKALHYIFGGWAQCMAQGAGALAGALKEQWDAAHGGQYDTADEQATNAGAEEARRRFNILQGDSAAK